MERNMEGNRETGIGKGITLPYIKEVFGVSSRTISLWVKPSNDDQGNVRLHKPDKIDPVVLFLTKIVSVADAYDALSHERSYKPALLPDEINPLLNDLFKDDPELVEMVMNMDD